jgi:hypothetical protein
MVVAMYYHMFPNAVEAARMHCNCVWHKNLLNRQGAEGRAAR